LATAVFIRISRISDAGITSGASPPVGVNVQAAILRQEKRSARWFEIVDIS
jgi:hypothetical protein